MMSRSRSQGTEVTIVTGAFCSVCSAKNPTVNDASGVTMLFAEAGMIFGVQQNNNNSVLHDSYVSFPSVIPDNV